MHFPKFRLRSMMILVAVFALGIWAAVMVRLRGDYLSRAAQHTAHEQSYRRTSHIRFAESFPAEDRQELLLMRARLADFHDEMRRKWERAASRPWMPVSPDPDSPPAADWPE
jgi:hypothetical protein